MYRLRPLRYGDLAANVKPTGFNDQCVDCGQPSQGAARCPPCAYRSYARSAEPVAAFGHRGLPALPAKFTVIELATGADLGTYENEAEVAACLAFSRLSADDVEIATDMSAIARYASWS